MRTVRAQALRWSKSRPGLFEIFDHLTIRRASTSEHLTDQKQKVWTMSSSLTHFAITDYWPKGFWSFDVPNNITDRAGTMRTVYRMLGYFDTDKIQKSKAISFR